MDIIPTNAVAIFRRWESHEWGDVYAESTLFAVYGKSSSPGHYADRHVMSSGIYLIWLEDVVGMCGEQIPPVSLKPISPAARRIINHGLRRIRGRRVKMTPDAAAALIEFYTEEIVLLSSTGDALRHGQAVKWKAKCTEIGRHKRACIRLLDVIRSSDDSQGVAPVDTSNAGNLVL